eukprot:Em0008g450a
MAFFSQLPHRYGIQEEDDQYQTRELYWAAQCGDTATVVALLERGVNINAPHDLLLVTSSSQRVLHHQTGEHTPALSSIVVTPLWSHALGKHAVSLLGKFNKGALISKLDLQAAFPMVPVLASKWELLGMHCNTYKACVMYLATWPNARLIAIILSTKLAINLALSIGCSMAASNFPRKTSIFLSGTEISPNSRSKDGQTALHISSKNGHTDTVVALLERGADINARDKNIQTALHISSKNGHTDTVVALLERRAYINSMDKDEQTALHMSSKNGHTHTMLALLKFGADIKARDKDGQTALHISSKNGHTDTMVALLERGAYINARDEDGQTALHISSKNGHTNTVVALLERGADINARDKMHHTPLDLARQHGHGTVVEVLESIEMKETELWAASRDGDTNRVLSLLDTRKGINVNTRDEDQNTSLLLSSKNGHTATVVLLLERGAKINAKDKIFYQSSGYRDITISNFLICCCFWFLIAFTFLISCQPQHMLQHQTSHHTPTQSSIVVAPLWKEKGGRGRFNKGALVAKLDLQAAFPMDPVLASKLIAIILSTKLAINLALSIGCSMAASNFPRKTSIFLSGTEISPNSRSKVSYAVYKLFFPHSIGDIKENEVVHVGLQTQLLGRLLLPQVHHSQLLLHLAHATQELDIAGSLLDDLPQMPWYLDIEILPKYGQTALHISSENGYTDTMVALLERGADIDARDKDGLAALHSTSENGHTDTVVALLERGAYIEARDEDRQTALHISSKNGHTDTVVALLERGADINARDKYGQTALHISSKNGHTDTVVALLERGADINARDKCLGGLSPD